MRKKGLYRGDEIKDFNMKRSWISRWALNPITKIVVKEKQREI